MYDTAALTRLLGTLDLLSTAFLSMPQVLPQLATVTGLAARKDAR